MFKNENANDEKYLPTPQERQKLVRDAKLILLQAQVLLENLDSTQTDPAARAALLSNPASLWSLFAKNPNAQAILRLRN